MGCGATTRIFAAHGNELRVFIWNEFQTAIGTIQVDSDTKWAGKSVQYFDEHDFEVFVRGIRNEVGITSKFDDSLKISVVIPALTTKGDLPVRLHEGDKRRAVLSREISRW